MRTRMGLRPSGTSQSGRRSSILPSVTRQRRSTEMTKEEVIRHHKECQVEYDMAKHRQEVHQTIAEGCGREAAQWLKRITAWRQIHLNLFDEPMPDYGTDEGASLINETVDLDAKIVAEQKKKHDTDPTQMYIN